MDVPDRFVASRAVRYGSVGLFAGWVLVASVVDPPAGAAAPPGPLGVPLDKLVHASTYATLGGLLAYALLPRRPLALLAVALAATGYGAGIEVVQAFLPLRTFEVLDLAANGLGATVAALCWPAVGAILGTVETAVDRRRAADRPRSDDRDSDCPVGERFGR